MYEWGLGGSKHVFGLCMLRMHGLQSYARRHAHSAMNSAGCASGTQSCRSKRYTSGS